MTRPPATPARQTRLVLVVVLALALALLGAGRASGEPGALDPVGRWPLAPVPTVVEGFDPPSTTWGAGHRGVDLLGVPGQRVRAALPGTVSFAGRIAGRDVVVVDHGDTRTTYEPVASSLDVGRRVVAGAPLGRLQLFGSHCFPRACLHWGWLRGATYLDPLGLVGAATVRLLPLWRVEPVGVGPVEAVPATAWAPPTLPYAAWSPWAGRSPGYRNLVLSPLRERVSLRVR